MEEHGTFKNKGQWGGIGNPFRSHKQQIDQEALKVCCIHPDPKIIGECGINQDNETSESMRNGAKYSRSMEHVHKPNFKLRICRCPEMAAQDKRRHVIFCVSISFMFLCLVMFIFAFVNMLHRDEKSNIITNNVVYDVLLIVFGLATFISILVAFCSQRHADSSIFKVARKFIGTSMEWTYVSVDKPCDATAGEVI